MKYIESQAMAEELKDSVVRAEGSLEFHFTLLTPARPHEELPDAPYIHIQWIRAEPRGRGLLKRYAGEMIAQIRARLKSDRPVIFQPANGEMGNKRAQEKLERYYLSCGFRYLPTSTSKWWMTWP